MDTSLQGLFVFAVGAGVVSSAAVMGQSKTMAWAESVGPTGRICMVELKWLDDKYPSCEPRVVVDQFSAERHLYRFHDCASDRGDVSEFKIQNGALICSADWVRNGEPVHQVVSHRPLDGYPVNEWLCHVGQKNPAALAEAIRLWGTVADGPGGRETVVFRANGWKKACEVSFDAFGRPVELVEVRPEKEAGWSRIGAVAIFNWSYDNETDRLPVEIESRPIVDENSPPLIKEAKPMRWRATYSFPEVWPEF